MISRLNQKEELKMSVGRLILQKSDSGDAIRYTYNGPDITKIAFEKWSAVKKRPVPFVLAYE